MDYLIIQLRRYIIYTIIVLILRDDITLIILYKIWLIYSYRIWRSSRDYLRRSGVHFQRQRRIRVGSRGIGKIQIRRARQIRTVAGQYIWAGKGHHADVRSVSRQYFHCDWSPIAAPSGPVEIQNGRFCRRQTSVFRQTGVEGATFSR